MYRLPWVSRPLNGVGETEAAAEATALEIGLHVRTHNGVFTNEGHGGGVFNLNTAFGSVETNARSIGALAVNKVLPASCWNKPGFKDCHAVAYSEAQSKCNYCAEHPEDEWNCGGFTTIANCIEREANANAWDNCVSTFCPSESPTMKDINLNFTEYKRGEACSSENTIKNVQFVSGTKTDGKWGPLSQEAYETLVRVQGTKYCDLVPGCTGPLPFGGSCSSAPVPLPSPSPNPQPLPEPEPEPTGTTQASMGGLMIAGLAVLLAAGTIAYLGQGKKK